MFLPEGKPPGGRPMAPPGPIRVDEGQEQQQTTQFIDIELTSVCLSPREDHKMEDGGSHGEHVMGEDDDEIEIELPMHGDKNSTDGPIQAIHHKVWA